MMEANSDLRAYNTRSNHSSKDKSIVKAMRKREEGRRTWKPQIIRYTFAKLMHELSESMETYNGVSVGYITHKFKHYYPVGTPDLHRIIEENLILEKKTYEETKEIVIMAIFDFVFSNFYEFLIYYERHGDIITKDNINSAVLCREFKSINQSRNFMLVAEAYDDLFRDGVEPFTILDDMLVFMHYELKNYYRQNPRPTY
jgi:hypothetical protein